jgi:2-oxoglutarate ferredoxin oxidoreductase subunit alpha
MTMPLSFIEGNEAISRGAIASGCRFFAGYPITPATTILNTMLTLLPPLGGVCLQAEDEIASIGACLGASMAGLKVMTATSGPGISLYSEHISFAVGSEIPIVIVDVQRLGPSTGSATRGADGDICFLRWGNSGGMPVIVLAPVNAADCFTLTMHAFNLAEKFRCPVFIASNKEIGMTRESVDFDALEMPDIINRTPPTAGKPFLPFQVDDGQRVPNFLPIGSDIPVRQTSSTHGANGYITTNTQEISRILGRLKNKLESAVSEFSFYEFLVLKTLWPLPEDVIRRRAQGVKRVVVVEMNLGQYVFEIKRILVDQRVDFCGQMDGRLITPHKIKETIIHG